MSLSVSVSMVGSLLAHGLERRVLRTCLRPYPGLTRVLVHVPLPEIERDLVGIARHYARNMNS
jgi:hypothetical protein